MTFTATPQTVFFAHVLRTVRETAPVVKYSTTTGDVPGFRKPEFAAEIARDRRRAEAEAAEWADRYGSMYDDCDCCR